MPAWEQLTMVCWPSKCFSFNLILIFMATLPFDISSGELSMHFKRLYFHLIFKRVTSLSISCSRNLSFFVHLPFDLQITKVEGGWDKCRHFDSGVSGESEWSEWQWDLFVATTLSPCWSFSFNSSKVPVRSVSSRYGGADKWVLKLIMGHNTGFRHRV